MSHELPAPAVVVTVWGHMSDARPALERLAAAAGPGDLAVAVHSTNPSEAAVRVVLELGLRLWVALPYDPVASELRAKGGAAARALATTYARRAAAHRPEVIELNGEARWKPDAGADLATLASLALDSIAATRELGAPVAWTSFDHLSYHRLPWAAIYGPGGVDIATPQKYAVPAKGVGDFNGARARVASADRQWQALVRKGTVRRDLAPGLPAHAAYGQVHHLTPGAAAAVLDTSATSRAWALPTRVDDAGVAGLEALLVARRETGRSAGAIARLQAAHGLDADGNAGPRTLELVRELVAR